MNSAPLPYQLLRRQGLTQREIETATRTGTLAKLRRGIYWAPDEQGERERHRALLLGTAPLVDGTNVVSHQSAAVLHNLPLPAHSLDRVYMTRLSTGHGDTGTDLRVRKTRLASDEITEIDGFAVTTLARTAVDLAKVLPYEWGVVVCDAALGLGLTAQELHSSVHRYRRLKGLPRARMAAAFADPRSESPAESLSRVQLASAALPIPQLQAELFDATGVFVARPDFLWDEYQLVGEVDGRWKYDQLLRPGETSSEVIMREKRREEALRQAGYWIVRWDWAAIRSNNVAPLVRRALLNQAKSLGLPVPH